MNYGKVMMVSISGLLMLAVLSSGQSSTKISASEAKNHIGETATVCGPVASTRYADKTNGSPTFLNLDKPYPAKVFTVLIWGSNRSKFGEPEKTFDKKTICVTGKIQLYQDAPEIEAAEAKQIVMQP